MIILYEILCLILLILSGWLRSRFYLMLFVLAEVFALSCLAMAIYNLRHIQRRILSYQGDASLGSIPWVRIHLVTPVTTYKRVRVCLEIEMADGRRSEEGPKKQRKGQRLPRRLSKKDSSHIRQTYRVTLDSHDDIIRLPIPTLAVGEMRVILHSITVSDPAGLWFLSNVNHAKDSTTRLSILPADDWKALVVKDTLHQDYLRNEHHQETSQVKGQGDLKSLRSYRPGDSKRDIHWNLSARLGELTTREYQGQEVVDVQGIRRHPGRMLSEEELQSLSAASIGAEESLKPQFTRKEIRIEGNRAQSVYKAYQKQHRKERKYVSLEEAVLRIALLLLFLVPIMLQMDLLPAYFGFNPVVPTLWMTVLLLFLCLSPVRWIYPIGPLLMMFLSIWTYRKELKNSRILFFWFQGSYQADQHNPDGGIIMLTGLILVAMLFLTVISYFLTKTRGGAIFFALVPVIIHLTQAVSDQAKDDTELSIALCLTFLSILCLLCLNGMVTPKDSLNGTIQEESKAIAKKEKASFGNGMAALSGLLAGLLIIALTVSGILPYIVSNHKIGLLMAKSDVMSGRTADRTNDYLYQKGYNFLTSDDRKANHMVVLDGKVGQQNNIYTGAEQFSVVADEMPSQDAYFRYFVGQNYREGEWTSDDDEALLDQVSMAAQSWEKRNRNNKEYPHYRDFQLDSDRFRDDCELFTGDTQDLRANLNDSYPWLQNMNAIAKEVITNSEADWDDSVSDIFYDLYISNNNDVESGLLSKLNMPFMVSDEYNRTTMQGLHIPSRMIWGFELKNASSSWDSLRTALELTGKSSQGWKTDIPKAEQDTGDLPEEEIESEEELEPAGDNPIDITDSLATEPLDDYDPLYSFRGYSGYMDSRYLILQEFYEKYYEDNYLQIPAEGIDHTRQLVEENPLESREEVTAFIRYVLASHATYSLHARDPLGDVDPVEYFLFTSHQGYCEHYASAACLLYRLYGIPARYVTGYRAQKATFQDSAEGYKSSVKDSDAHAWVEIYYPTTGWTPVEMTPRELEAGAPKEQSGYPTDHLSAGDLYQVIWPGFTENDILAIQEERGWTGREWRTVDGDSNTQKVSDPKQGTNATTTSNPNGGKVDTKKPVQNQVRKVDKKNPILTFVEGHKALTAIGILLLLMILGLVLRIIQRGMWRKKHPDMALARQTDFLIQWAGPFCITLETDETRHQSQDPTGQESTSRNLFVQDLTSQNLLKLFRGNERTLYGRRMLTKDELQEMNLVYITLEEKLVKWMPWYKRMVYPLKKAFL